MNKQVIVYLIAIIAILWTVPALAETPWQSAQSAGLTLEYRVTQDSQNLECKLMAQSTGWLAVGFNPTSVMRNANIIIGYVSGGTPNLRDDWGNSNTTHVSDTSMGGSSNLTIISGTESGGSTTLHFTIPLNSGDQYDRPLVIGQSYPIILARGNNSADNYTGMHADAGNATITIQAPVAIDESENNLPVSKILSNYPNPFNPQTTIRYSLSQSGEAELNIYNIRGELVHRKGFIQPAGIHSYIWNADGLPSGTYLVRLQSGNAESAFKISLRK